MKLTQRKINGFYISFFTFTVIIIGSTIYNNIDFLNSLSSFISLDHKIVAQYTMVTAIIPQMITFLFWGIRNKLWEGTRAFKRYYIVFNLRQALLDASYYDDRFSIERVAKLPKIKVQFYDKSGLAGKFFVRASLKFYQRIENAEFTPILQHYLVENSYLSKDGNWFVFEFYSVSTQLQTQFDDLKTYLKATNEKTNEYQLHYDNRLVKDLSHFLLTGPTRTGKTYALIGLLLQMVNKPIKYELWFCDPKNDQIEKIGRWINSSEERVAVTSDDIIILIDKLYQRLEAREKEMKSLTKDRITGDYKDVHLKPIILVFDEFSSFIVTLENKQKKDVIGKLTAIVQRGAGSGVFLWIVMQKSDASDISTAIRSNLILKIVLGNAPETTYRTTFEKSVSNSNLQFTIGQGLYMDDTMPSEKLINFPYLKFLDDYNDGTKSPESLWNVSSFDKK